MHKAKILVTCSAHPSRGKGISTFSKNLALMLRTKYEVFYLCPKSNDPNDYYWFEENSISPLYFDPAGEIVDETMKINTMIRKLEHIDAIFNNDVIHINNIAPIINHKIISFVHLDNYSIVKAALINIDYLHKVVAISNDMLESLMKRHQGYEDKFCMLNNSLPILDTKINIHKNLVIIAGTEYSRRKGSDLLVKLLKRLMLSNIKFKFYWIGKIPQKIKSIFKHDSRINIINQLPRDEYLQIVSNGSLYLFPSREEGSPMSLKEAMQLGLVPICNRGVGAMSQIVEHGTSGFVIPESEWIEFSFKLISKISRKQFDIKKISVESQKRINSNFSNEKYLEKILNLIDQDSKNIPYTKNILKIYRWHRLPVPLLKKSLFDYLNLIKFKIGLLTYKKIKLKN